MSPYRTAVLAAAMPWLLAASPPGALDRRALVAEVVAHDPAIDATLRALDAVVARERTITQPDPMIGWSVAPLSLGAAVPFGHTVEASQRLVVSGRLGLERAASRAREAAAAHDVEAARIEVALVASMLYDDWWVVDQALVVNEAHQRLVAELMTAATSAWTASRASQSAPLQAEVVGLGLERDRIALTAERDRIRARIDALLLRPADAPLALVAETEPPALASLPPLAVDDRPDLARLAEQATAADRLERAARRGWFPDLTLMGSYSTMWMDPEHRLMAGVAVDVPVHPGARRAEAAMARADGAMTRAEAVRARFDAEGEVEMLRVAAVAAHDGWVLTSDRLVPAARQRLDAATVGFQSGGARFDEVIEAWRDLLDAEFGAIEARADFERHRAALEAATGRVPVLSRTDGGAR